MKPDFDSLGNVACCLVVNFGASRRMILGEVDPTKTSLHIQSSVRMFLAESVGSVGSSESSESRIPHVTPKGVL